MDDYIELYTQIYKSLDSTTPMLFDCGLLCDSACCKDNGLGMLLFPGEDQYINLTENDFTIIDSDFKVNGVPAKLLSCTGQCNRTTRPLACRIFPLFPFLHNDRLTVDFDPRAKGTCPILYDDIEEIYTRGLFRLKVLNIANSLIAHKPIKEFLEDFTKELDEISRFRL